jgi:hypothetical protein
MPNSGVVRKLGSAEAFSIFDVLKGEPPTVTHHFFQTLVGRFPFSDNVYALRVSMNRAFSCGFIHIHPDHEKSCLENKKLFCI